MYYLKKLIVTNIILPVEKIKETNDVEAHSHCILRNDCMSLQIVKFQVLQALQSLYMQLFDGNYSIAAM